MDACASVCVWGERERDRHTHTAEKEERIKSQSDLTVPPRTAFPSHHWQMNLIHTSALFSYVCHKWSRY